MNDLTVFEQGMAETVSKEVSAANNTYALAQSYVIDSPEMAEGAAEELGYINGAIKRLDEERLSLTRPLDESKKRIMAMFEAPKKRLQDAKSLLQKSLGDYTAAERKRIEEERKKAEEHQRAMAEQLRKEAEEKARIAAEAMAAAEAECKTEDLEAAEALEQEAQAVAAAANSVENMAAMPATPEHKLEGVSSRENWDFEIIDENLIPREYLIPDLKKIRGVVKALKSGAKISGVKVFSTSTIVARSKR